MLGGDSLEGRCIEMKDVTEGCSFHSSQIYYVNVNSVELLLGATESIIINIHSPPWKLTFKCWLSHISYI